MTELKEWQDIVKRVNGQLWIPATKWPIEELKDHKCDSAIYSQDNALDKLFERFVQSTGCSLIDFIHSEIIKGRVLLFDRIWQREEKKPITLTEGEVVTTAEGRKLKLVEVES